MMLVFTKHLKQSTMHSVPVKLRVPLLGKTGVASISLFEKVA